MLIPSCQAWFTHIHFTGAVCEVSKGDLMTTNKTRFTLHPVLLRRS